MPRADLLALSPDDLAAITNRGIVKRAQKELESNAATYTIDEPDGAPLVVAWSDGVTCRFPIGKTIHDAVCSSGAIGVTRHIVRSVFAYQAHHASSAEPPAASPKSSAAEVPSPGESSSPCDVAAPTVAAAPSNTAAALSAAPATRRAAWDPGTISDDALVAHYRAPAIAKAQQRFNAGVLVELTRGEKPTARFLDEPCLVRFLVPGDLRYITADCAEPLLATFVPLAVWAFRALPADRPAGLVSIQQGELPTPVEKLDELQALLVELIRDGLTNVGASWGQRLTRLEAALRDAGLVWPAEGANELAHQLHMYQSHDARFDPVEVVAIVGELIARRRAIVRQTSAAPQLLIRGTRSDKVAEIAGGRMIGLGCGARTTSRSATLSVYLQDVDSGGVMVVERSFAEPLDDPARAASPPRPFSDLAGTIITRGVSIGALGASQLLLKSGKRAPSGQLTLPRTAGSMTTNPQAYAWEHLKPPAAVESFAQLHARLQALPPSYLRPRRLTENLHVVAIERIEEPVFDAASQRLAAVMRDSSGGAATLLQPYHSRAAGGFEALHKRLAQHGAQARFVCGHVHTHGGSLVVQPTSIVFDDGLRRTCLQPWIATSDGGVASSDVANTSSASMPDEREGPEENGSPMGSPLDGYLESQRQALAELLLSGVKRADARRAGEWRALVEKGRRLGFVRLVEPLEKLATLLAQRQDEVRWEATPAARATLELCLLSRVAADAAL